MSDNGSIVGRPGRPLKAGAVIGCLVVIVFVAWLEAKPSFPEVGEAKTIRGVVREATYAPKGEVDGVTLEDGTWVHWPPHLEDRFASIAAKGTRIEVTGWTVTGPKGDTKFEVRTLTNLATGVTRENDFGPPPFKGKFGKKGRFRSEAMTVTGRVRSFTSAPKGEVDGLMLDDGTWVHWPPHEEDRYAKIAAKGDRVRVTGWLVTGPKGDTKLEVQTLSNLGAQGTGTSAAAGKSDNMEERLRSLEERLEILLKEIKSLRREK